MENKTIVVAGEGRTDLLITREFELPVDLLFRAYAEAEFLEQWMGTRVIQLESRPHGSYRFETSDPQGNIVFKANGVIHAYEANKKITRTFEMENAGFGVQLEFLEFEALNNDRSKLTIHSIFRSEELRAKQLQLPFSYGINMAHGRLEEVMSYEL